MTESGRHIAILGGGIIGCAAAYYLTLLNEDPALHVTIIERHEIACGASGRAAGFLQSNWNDGGPLEDLSKKSFQLHADLAKKLNGKKRYDYRPIDTLSITASIKSSNTRAPPTEWIKNRFVQSFEQVGTLKTTAQLHPYKFTIALKEEAESRGAKIRIARVTGLVFDRYRVTGVRLNDDEVLSVDTIVVAMGPWSGKFLHTIVRQGGRAYSLPNVSGQKVHSLIVHPDTPISPNICFVELSLGHKFTEPEFYPRPDGDVYISGHADDSALTDSALDVQPSTSAIKNLKRDIKLLSPDVLAEAPVVRENACFMPISDDKLPLIGKVPWLDGVYLATGHSVWGISNSTGTGLVVAEMILEGQAKSVDIRAFAPMRPKGNTLKR